MVVRVAREADLPRVLALLRHLHPAETPPEPEAAAAAWAAMLRCGLVSVLLAEVEGVAAAACTLAVVPNLTRGARPYGVIENVVTDPAHRRAGLGRAVLRAALERAWATECYKVMLATGSREPGTLAFYAAAGFTGGGKTYFEVRRAG